MVLRVSSSPNSAMVMPACSKMAQKIIAAIKNTKTAARRWPSRSPRMENHTIAATGMRMKPARSHWKRGSSDSTVRPITASVPTTTSRLMSQCVEAPAGAAPTSPRRGRCIT